MLDPTHAERVVVAEANREGYSHPFDVRVQVHSSTGLRPAAVVALAGHGEVQQQAGEAHGDQPAGRGQAPPTPP